MPLFRQRTVKAPQSSADAAVMVYSPNYAAPSPAPATSYRYSRTRMTSGLTVPAETIRTRSAAVDRHYRRNGLRYQYSYGGTDMGQQLKPPFSGAASGTVQSSRFQPIQNSLVFNAFNDALYRAGGFPRNLGFSFRVPKLPTAIAANSGGPTTGMRARGIFTKVQTIPRYRTVTPSYNTTSARV